MNHTRMTMKMIKEIKKVMEKVEKLIRELVEQQHIVNTKLGEEKYQKWMEIRSMVKIYKERRLLYKISKMRYKLMLLEKEETNKEKLLYANQRRKRLAKLKRVSEEIREYEQKLKARKWVINYIQHDWSGVSSVDTVKGVLCEDFDIVVIINNDEGGEGLVAIFVGYEKNDRAILAVINEELDDYHQIVRSLKNIRHIGS